MSQSIDEQLKEQMKTAMKAKDKATLTVVRMVRAAMQEKMNQPNGPKEVAVDTVQAGVGDFVYLVGSREATLALEETFVPVDAAVVAIVDDLHRTVES